MGIFDDDFEDLESLDELNKQEDNNEGIDEPENLETAGDDVEEPLPPNKPRKLKKKPVIPPNAHPIEVFMITKEFEWGEITGITRLSKETLLNIIRGDEPTEYERNRIRLTTRVKL